MRTLRFVPAALGFWVLLSTSNIGALDIPLFNQKDYNQRLGTCTKSTIASHGCAVTSKAMVFKHFKIIVKVPSSHSSTRSQRIGMDPAILDDWLTWKGGYKHGCLMKWANDPPGIRASKRHYNSSTTGIDAETYAYIDKALANDDPVIAGVHWSGKRPAGVQKDEDWHWVVITSRNDNTYNINDPWNGKRTTLKDGELGHYIIDHYYSFAKTLARVKGHKEVYWLQNGKLYWVTSWDVIQQMSSLSGWDRVTEYPSNIFNPNDYTRGPRFILTDPRSDGLLIRQRGDYKVYLMKNGQRKWITTQEIFNQRGCDWDDVIKVTQAIINSIPEGSPITRAEPLPPPESGIPAEIKLKDKSVIKGEIQQEKIKIKTKYGEMDIPVENFVSIIGQLIELKDGTTLKGNFVEKVLNVKTGYGKLKLQTKDIDSIIFVKEAEPPPKPERLTPVIEGLVLDNFGNPLEGVRVYIEKTTLEAKTDTRGRYSIEYPPGVFTIIAEKKGYRSTTRELAVTTSMRLPAEDMMLFKLPKGEGIFVYGESDYDYTELKKTKVKEGYNREGEYEYYPIGSPTIVRKRKIDVVVNLEPFLSTNIWLFMLNARGRICAKKTGYGILGKEIKEVGEALSSLVALVKGERPRTISGLTLEEGDYAFFRPGILPGYCFYFRIVAEETVNYQKQYKFERYGGIMLCLESDLSKLPSGISAKEVTTENINRIKDRLKTYEESNAENILIYREGAGRIRIQTIGGFKNPQRLLDLIVKTGHLEFRLIDEKADLNKALKGELPSDDEILYDSRGRPYLVKKGALFREEMVKDGEVKKDQENQPYVVVKFNPEGTDKLSEITAKHQGERLAIILDNVIKSASVIKTRISSGRLLIQANLTEEEAQDIATIIKSGSLAVPANIIQNTWWGGDVASGFSRGVQVHVKFENSSRFSSQNLSLKEACQEIREALNSNGMNWCMVQRYGKIKDNLYMIWVDFRSITAEIEEEAERVANNLRQKFPGSIAPRVQQVLKEQGLGQALSNRVEEILKDRKGQIRSVNIIEQVKGELKEK